MMKKVMGLFILTSVLSACSDLALKWIDTPYADTGRISLRTDDKEIVSFTFGIEGETDLSIGNQHDISGEIPITIILPEGNGLNALTPSVVYTGKSLNPPSGAAMDFSSPVTYTVAADDGSTADYRVKVYVKGHSSKEIVHFAIDLPQSGTLLSADGTIDQEKGAITVIVPSGTGLSYMTAHVTHTGALTLGPLGAPHSTETFDFTGDFSADTSWTVVAGDDSTKKYTVTIVREKSHDKAITSFRLGVAGEEDLIGGEPQPDGKYPILALVPKNAALNKAPFIDYVGESISPAPETSLDFSTPKTYTVTAEDGSVREYTVYIVEKNGVDGADKIITGFYFQEPLVRGVIDQVKHTIALTVPAGTDLGALRPEIYYKGASVSPISGQPRDFTGAAADPAAPVLYTVRDQEGGSQNYEVSVFIAPSPPVVDASGAESGKATQSAVAPDFDRDSGNYPVIVEFPAHIENPAYIGNLTYIENPVLTITYPAASADDNETLNQILNQLILLQNKEVYSHITNET
ncbi:MAG: DUF5018 domain-containing protein, partial [Treponema sp.]|nr:DUF5018 domain-containing protein [Treponema sp.]